MSSRIVIGWHSCVEAIKVRPNEIAKIFLEESKLVSVKGNAPAINHSKSKAPSSKVKSKSSFSDKEDRFAFLNEKSLRNKVQYKPRSFFEKWGSGHQGIAVEITSLEPSLSAKILKKEQSVLVALDEIEDPTNLGNILRTSWLMGVGGLLVTQDRSVKLTPQVCKIASGGAEHVPVEIVHPMDQSLENLKKDGYWVYGLDAQADQTIYDVDFSSKVILVAGNEGKGLRKTTLKACDVILKIPQTSDVASLNVATSLAITLSQVQRAFLNVDDNPVKK